MIKGNAGNPGNTLADQSAVWPKLAATTAATARTEPYRTVNYMMLYTLTVVKINKG